MELLPREDETLLVGRDPLAVLDPGLHHVDCLRGPHIDDDGPAVEHLDEDLHGSIAPSVRDSAAAPQHGDEVERRLPLDVVVRERVAVLEVFPREDEALLVDRDPLRVLDLDFQRADGVQGLHIQDDGLACDRLDHDRVPPADEVERQLLPDGAVRELAFIFELLPRKDEALLVGWDPLHVL
eukprot:CAMPEP_0180371416 /NCGR_PEP_ID=MMETSP0989-20121125/19802_1 /TAXON_ID=697907 /ORGANISM="non described non described, Strain CCMP2293" /LENGTH=181 /DNA_ID=CAMNT_0022367427 /DNA_START=518 /DNA_END=1060 /DNA_ORIENTATION=-